MVYSGVGAHGTMALDDVRNTLYAQAIRKLVTPDSVVLDLGAGLGVHGLMAAAAGAGKVYLVEPEAVLQIAMEIARANGFDERVVAFQSCIEDTSLPEPVDLIVSALTGNLLFSEDLLPSLFHARDRYLKPGGVLVPDIAELMVAPVSAPDFHAQHVQRWSQPNMGIDFSAARRFAVNEILWPKREAVARMERLAPGQALATLDLTRATRADCHGQALCGVSQDSTCHGVLAWIRMRLVDEWLSTDPAGPEVHWSAALLPLDPPLPVKVGENIHLTMSRPERGDWVWSASAGAGSRRHSSFLAQADGLRTLKIIAPASQPGLGPTGVTALQILSLMQQGLSNGEIAAVLCAAASTDPAAALREVQALALRYAA